MNGELLTTWPVLKHFVRTDRLINMAIVKHHSLSSCTLGMKNLYGILGGRRNQLHQRIDQSIVDLAAFAKPTLTVLDATRVLLRPASPGTGVIAGGGVRAVMESAGVQDVLTKIVGSRNPFNVVRATFDAINNLMTTKQVQALRGVELGSAAEEAPVKADEPEAEAAAEVAEEATEEAAAEEAETS